MLQKGKRIGAVMLGVLLCLVGIRSENFAFAESRTTQLVNNIVLFAQFQDTSTSNFMDTYTDEMVAMCNDTGTQRSLASYIDTISDKQMAVKSHFPQMQGSVILPYQLQHTKEDYWNVELLTTEVISHVDIPQDMALDGNQDGWIDNIVVVVDGEANTTDDLFWPCAFHLTGIEKNGLEVGTVNLQNSTSLFESYISGGVGVLCHEFLHSIGYPDLYHSEAREGTPVGAWDIMASTSIFLQYPLAYQRASVSGWLETGEITTDGTYHLKPASDSSGNRVFIIKTPFSDTEFFAVEYRKKGTPYSEEMDTKIYGTGLVVYRINTEENGNYQGEKDGVYVFRPDETIVDAGAGNLSASYYGGADTPNQIGSLDYTDGIADGALVYSDGTNSGIQISNMVLTEDGADFDVSFADEKTAGFWKITGHTGDLLSAEESSDIAVAEDGSLYLLSSNGKYAAVSHYENGAWTEFGQRIGSGTYGSVNLAQLIVCDNIPYLFYRDADYRYVLCAYDETDGTWKTKSSSSTLAQYADATVMDGKIYIAYTSGTMTYTMNVMCYDPQTEANQTIGETIGENVCHMAIVGANGKITIAYRDLADSDFPKAAVWDGEAWKIISIAENSCGTVSAAADGDIVWVAADTGLYEISGETVTSMEMPDGTAQNCFSAIPAIWNGKLYLAVNTQAPDDFSVYCRTDDIWQRVGNHVADELVNAPEIAFYEDTIYAAYGSVLGIPIVKQYTLESASQVPNGDVNQDGAVNSADVVLLQRYLLGDVTMTLQEIQYADVFADTCVNGLDLAKLRQVVFAG